MPCCRMEPISSCSASRAKSLRGCNALGTMVAKLIWCTLSPDSAASVRVATDGVPISAPRPLPRPVRAMRLRLREQSEQRKQQTAPPPRVVENQIRVLTTALLQHLRQSTDSLRGTEDPLKIGICSRHIRSAIGRDRKSTRLNSSHPSISYAVFCL